MNVYKNINEIAAVKKPVVTTGTFDGVHLGHRKIIARLIQIAEKTKGETVLLTFHPHPRLVLHPEETNMKMLNTLEERTELLEKAGIQHLIIHPFTKEFANISSADFIKDILAESLKTKKLVIGYNHHFGKNREGSFEHLKKFGPTYGFDVEEISAQDVDDIEISSTHIRNALTAGDIKTANKYLGYPYFISGIVVDGKKLGRTLGYPTANIEIGNKYKLIPSEGIYAVKVEHEKKEYKGMMSIGQNPTVNGTKQTIEVNIFDFNKEIYGETLRICFFEKLRDEVKFDSLNTLKEQLALDKTDTLKVLK